VAVDPASLLAPLGELELSTFTGESPDAVLARATGAVSAALGRATADSVAAGNLDHAVRAEAYRLLFDAAAQRLAGLPGSHSLTDQGSVTISPSSVKFFEAKAAAWGAAYSRLLPVPTVDAAAPRVGGAARTRIRW
jgi:hypothetical protein